MDPLQAVLLGSLEGFTEFLPISSTGHLILASTLLGIPADAGHTSFLIAVQLGAICAVLARYWRRFLDVPFLQKLFVAFLPTGLVGFLVYPFVKGYLLGNPYVVVGALALGGVALIAFERFHREREDAPESPTAITYPQALLVGLVQSIAIVPGVSRSAATVVGGLAAGMRRTAIVEFSFLLAVPTMLAATSYDLYKSAHTFSADDAGMIAIGFSTAFVVALLSMRVLLALAKRVSFTPFGIYRIVLAILFYLIVLQ
jgi:undecaprenyl-diphosphatase